MMDRLLKAQTPNKDTESCYTKTKVFMKASLWMTRWRVKADLFFLTKVYTKALLLVDTSKAEASLHTSKNQTSTLLRKLFTKASLLKASRMEKAHSLTQMAQCLQERSSKAKGPAKVFLRTQKTTPYTVSGLMMFK